MPPKLGLFPDIAGLWACHFCSQPPAMQASVTETGDRGLQGAFVHFVCPGWAGRGSLYFFFKVYHYILHIAVPWTRGSVLLVGLSSQGRVAITAARCNDISFIT